MNQRRRLAVLSEHMESRLVLSPMAMLPMHGGGAIAEQDVAETATDNSEVSERSADRSQVASQVSERISTVQNETSTHESSDGRTSSPAMVVDDGTSLSPIVDTNVNTDALGITAGTSLTSGNDENIVGSHQPVGGTPSTLTAQSPLVESSPGSVDVVVKQEQRSAGDVSANEQSSADNEVSAAPLDSSDAVTVPVTDTLSRVKSASASSTDASPSKVPAVSSAVGTSTERSREDLDSKLTSNEKGDANDTTEVRSVSSETLQDVVFGAAGTQGRESGDVVVALEDTSRTASVSNVSKVYSEQRDVVKMTVAATDTASTLDVQQRSDARPVAITDAEVQALQSDETIVFSDRIRETNADTDVAARSINDGGEGRVVPVAPSESQHNDTNSGLGEDQQTVGSTTETDGDTQPVPAELPLTAGDDTTNISSVTTKQSPTGRIEETNASGGWLPDMAHASEAYPAVRISAATTSDSAQNLQWRSWLMMAKDPAETDADHEQSESTHTFFGDATRVGLMLAAVRHAGRRSGTVFSVVDSAEELRGEGAPYSKERRRRRAATARRVPTTFDRLRQAVNSLESVDEHNSLPNAVPAPDAVFADAASMSLLYQHNFGSSHSERNGILWGSLLLGGAGLAASQASRRRKSQPRRPLTPPSVPRNGGETLRFAD